MLVTFQLRFFFIAVSFHTSHNKDMKNKEYLNASDIAAEIEALNQRIEEQEKKINDLLIVINNHLFLSQTISKK